MIAEQYILLALLIPLCGAVAIGVAGRFGPNVRECATLLTAGSLAWCVWQIAPAVYAGARPALELTELVPGISIAFQVEPFRFRIRSVGFR